MKEYNKLVRDRIPEIMVENGAKPEYIFLEEDIYYQELKKKLTEEIKEFIDSDAVEELADIEEILLSILKYKNFSYEEFTKLREEKANKRGSFEKRIYLKREL